jgi:hypothetical protein
MDTITAITDLLKSGGPYAVTAIALFVAGFLYRAREQLRKENAGEFGKLREENKALSDKIIDMVTRLTEVTTENNSSKARLIQLIEKWDDEIRRR